MATQQWNEAGRPNGPAVGWHPGIRPPDEREAAGPEPGERIDYEGYGEHEGWRVHEYPERAQARPAPVRRPQQAPQEERRIEYADSSQRGAEWDDRKAAYEREAERRNLLERERDRAHRADEQTEREKERKRSPERRQIEVQGPVTRDIEHSVRRESTATLIKDMVAEAQLLAREELNLAKAELREEAKQAGKTAGAASGSIGAGAALAYAGLLTLVLAAVVGLAFLIPFWLSALLVGAVALLVGGMMAMGGLSKLKSLSAPTAEETNETLKEDREWASEMMRGVQSRRRGHA